MLPVTMTKTETKLDDNRRVFELCPLDRQRVDADFAVPLPEDAASAAPLPPQATVAPATTRQPLPSGSVSSRATSATTSSNASGVSSVAASSTGGALTTLPQSNPYSGAQRVPNARLPVPGKRVTSRLAPEENY
jgi:hypothetical protein